MEKQTQTRHLKLIQGGNQSPYQSTHNDYSKVVSNPSILDHKVTRLTDWNKRLENLFAKQRV